jgi:hypothetical protein
MVEFLGQQPPLRRRRRAPRCCEGVAGGPPTPAGRRRGPRSARPAPAVADRIGLRGPHRVGPGCRTLRAARPVARKEVVSGCDPEAVVRLNAEGGLWAALGRRGRRLAGRAERDVRRPRCVDARCRDHDVGSSLRIAMKSRRKRGFRVFTERPAAGTARLGVTASVRASAVPQVAARRRRPDEPQHGHWQYTWY